MKTRNTSDNQNGNSNTSGKNYFTAFPRMMLTLFSLMIILPMVSSGQNQHNIQALQDNRSENTNMSSPAIETMSVKIDPARTELQTYQLQVTSKGYKTLFSTPSQSSDTNVMLVKSNLFEFSIGEDSIKLILFSPQKGLTFILEKRKAGLWNLQNYIYSGSVKDSLFKQAIFHNSGNNEYRIKYIDKSGKICYSSSVQFMSGVPRAHVDIDTENKKIILSRVINYEIFSIDHQTAIKSIGNMIDLHDFQKGVFWLETDNQRYKLVIK